MTIYLALLLKSVQKSVEKFEEQIDVFKPVVDFLSGIQKAKQQVQHPSRNRCRETLVQ